VLPESEWHGRVAWVAASCILHFLCFTVLYKYALSLLPSTCDTKALLASDSLVAATRYVLCTLRRDARIVPDSERKLKAPGIINAAVSVPSCLKTVLYKFGCF
jgi:hypothetical protein